ncbi:MAG: hypothetical protein WCS89_01680 [Candidatus Paceibacterota bacterium]|jgi:hypothetical protein
MKKIRSWNQTLFSWNLTEGLREGFRTDLVVLTDLVDNVSGHVIRLKAIQIKSEMGRMVELSISLDGEIPREIFERINSRIFQLLFEEFEKSMYYEAAVRRHHIKKSDLNWTLEIPRGKHFCEFAVDLGYKVIKAFGISTHKVDLPKFTFQQVTHVFHKGEWMSLDDYYWRNFVFSPK